MTPFTSYALTHGCLEDFSRDPFPTILSAWDEDSLSLPPNGTHFGFVQTGQAELQCGSGIFTISPGMYFAVPGAMQIQGGSGILITRLSYHGFFHLGGPVEDTGRLRYINSCTDSLLISPVLKGDPCINLLHLPPGTRQSAHTHSSLRVGLVIRGTGSCQTPEATKMLSPGLAFVIQADGLHCFHTDEESLLVLVYHPDSDFGPTHEVHPMINRTDLAQAREVLNGDTAP